MALNSPRVLQWGVRVEVLAQAVGLSEACCVEQGYSSASSCAQTLLAVAGKWPCSCFSAISGPSGPGSAVTAWNPQGTATGTGLLGGSSAVLPGAGPGGRMLLLLLIPVPGCPAAHCCGPAADKTSGQGQLGTLHQLHTVLGSYDAGAHSLAPRLLPALPHCRPSALGLRQLQWLPCLPSQPHRTLYSLHTLSCCCSWCQVLAGARVSSGLCFCPMLVAEP